MSIQTEYIQHSVPYRLFGPYSTTGHGCGNDFTQIPIPSFKGKSHTEFLTYFTEFVKSNIILDDTVGRENWIIGFKLNQSSFNDPND